MTNKYKIEEINWVTSFGPPRDREIPRSEFGTTVGSKTPQGLQQTAKFKGVLDKCSSMYTWQQKIYKALSSGVDIYVAAQPGAGKTLPYLCYWSDVVLDIDTLDIQSRRWRDYIKTISQLLLDPKSIPKLVILLPTRSLSEQTWQEFREHYSNMLANILNALLQKLFVPWAEGPLQPNQSLFDLSQQVIQKLLNSIHSALPQATNGRNRLYQRLVNMEANRSNVGEEQIEMLKREIETLDRHISNYAQDGIRDIVSGHRAEKSLIALRHGNESIGDIETAPVVIGIYESLKPYISKIKGNIALLVCDESHLIQDKEIRSSSRSTNIAFALYSILKTIDNNTRLCFLSGTANPAAAENFANYLKLCYNRKNLEVIEPPTSAGNQSQISVVADDSINSERELLSIMANSRTRNTVIVLFSKRKIDQLAQAALNKMGRKPLGNLSSQFKFTDLQARKPYSRYRNISQKPEIDVREVGRQAGRMEGASHIYDPMKREYAQAGFGVIYRVDDKDRYRKEKNKDNQITADLFQKGKIRTLLATDAIGVGVNINVKEMYIPTIEKFDGGVTKEMDPSELSQLINRTGRGAFPYSRVITTSRYVAPITKALSLSPRGFATGVTIEKIPKELCVLANAFKSIWQNQIKTHF